MQGFLGTLIFIVVCIVAFFIALPKSRDYTGSLKFLMTTAWWGGGVATFYAGATVVAGFLWVTAWIGIYLRYVSLWIINTVLYPWNWIF